MASGAINSYLDYQPDLALVHLSTHPKVSESAVC